MLWAAGPEAAAWYRNFTDSASQSSERRRSLIQALRTYGCSGAIILEGPITGTFTVLLPRTLLLSNRVPIAHSAAHDVPADVVEHVLGAHILAPTGLRSIPPDWYSVNGAADSA